MKWRSAISRQPICRSISGAHRHEGLSDAGPSGPSGRAAEKENLRIEGKTTEEAADLFLSAITETEGHLRRGEMDFSEHKGIYVIEYLANGKIQKVTGELTGEAHAYWLTSWGKRS